MLFASKKPTNSAKNKKIAKNRLQKTVYSDGFFMRAGLIRHLMLTILFE